ncbi:YceH family protein [Silvibacterium sp.]|uniref:YceH family protein n=1 Tax=Silvibacterium sp. TaxID=1964179 RepID=UPI0039E67BC8
MPTQLEPNELRVLGSLIEKEITTPEYYPLSLNALVNACNQKSSREPVMQLDEIAVERALSQLEDLSLVRRVHDSRVAKYEHQARSLLDLKRPEIAVLCLLLLRGPQTPGELRSRADRLYTFDDIGAVTSTLERLSRQPSEEDSAQRREHAPLVTLLPRQPGEKEARYAHTLGGTPVLTPREASPATASNTAPSYDRIAVLEAEVTSLRAELNETRERLARLESLFGIETAETNTGGNPN